MNDNHAPGSISWHVAKAEDMQLYGIFYGGLLVHTAETSGAAERLAFHLNLTGYTPYGFTTNPAAKFNSAAWDLVKSQLPTTPKAEQ